MGRSVGINCNENTLVDTILFNTESLLIIKDN